MPRNQHLGYSTALRKAPRGSAEPEQAPSTPLVAAIDAWTARHGPEGRWAMEDRGIRASLARVGYVGTQKEVST